MSSIALCCTLYVTIAERATQVHICQVYMSCIQHAHNMLECDVIVYTMENCGPCRYILLGTFGLILTKNGLMLSTGGLSLVLELMCTDLNDAYM